MSIVGKWGTSRDGEIYHGVYDSREEAVSEACGDRYVGRYRAPVLERVLDAEDLVDKVLCQDDYCGDWADGALAATDEQLAELTEIIRHEFVAWVDRHGLRPTFGFVADPEEIPESGGEHPEKEVKSDG